MKMNIEPARDWAELVEQIAQLEDLIAEAVATDDDQDAISIDRLRTALKEKKARLRAEHVG